MKQLAKSLVILSAVVTANSVSAGAIEGLCPFIGADFKQSFIKGKNDWNRVIRKNYPAAHAYIGAKFHDNAGLEVGYDWGKTRSKSYSFANGETWFGQNATGVTSKIRTRIRGAHVDLNGYYPVAHNVELIGSVGAGFLKPTLKLSVPNVNSSFVDNIINTKGDGKRRTVARLRVGAQYMFTQMFGVRALVGWSNTARLRLNADPTDPTPAINKPFKNQTSGSVGAFFTF